jgi:hypothetical protein
MYLQYATYSQIERKTGDTAASLIRYLKDFSAVVQAIDLGIPQSQISVITGLSEPLVGEYIALFRQYDIPDHQGVLDRIRRPLSPNAEAAWAEKGGLR